MHILDVQPYEKVNMKHPYARPASRCSLMFFALADVVCSHCSLSSTLIANVLRSRERCLLTLFALTNCADCCKAQLFSCPLCLHTCGAYSQCVCGGIVCALSIHRPESKHAFISRKRRQGVVSEQTCRGTKVKDWKRNDSKKQKPFQKSETGNEMKAKRKNYFKSLRQETKWKPKAQTGLIRRKMQR